MSPMNPFDTAEHLASLWGRSGDALLDAQRSLVQELAGWMPSVAPERAAPDEGYEAARRAFARSWETALDVSRAAAANLSGSGDPALEATLDRLLDPAAWFTQASGREPGLGDPSATTSLAEAATLVQRRRLEHDVVMVEAWMQAAGAFARALHAVAGQDATPQSPEAVTALWSRHADPVFAESERSDAFRRSRDRLAAARAELDATQRAVGQIYGYAHHRDLDDLRDTVARLRRHLDEVTARPGSEAALDVSAPALPVAAGVGEAAIEAAAAEAGPELPAGDEPASMAEPVEVRAERQPAIMEPPSRYVVLPHGGDGPALLIVCSPGDPAARDVADSLVRHDLAMHELAWSEAAWRGSLDDLVRDLASALDDLAHDVAPIALVGIGPGAIPLVCLAARRDVPALVVVDAAFAFEHAEEHVTDPDWLATLRREDALMRGTLAVAGEPVDLAAIACPVLNLVPGRADGPAYGSRALAHLVAADGYAERPVSRLTKAGPAVAEWLADRRQTR